MNQSCPILSPFYNFKYKLANGYIINLLPTYSSICLPIDLLNYLLLYNMSIKMLAIPRIPYLPESFLVLPILPIYLLIYLPIHFPECPDGQPPSQVCRKTMVNDANALANLDKQDTCPRGQACFTYGKPNVGHCCRLYCPYGQSDLSKSCAAGASSGERCPDQTTHYCQAFEDHGVKNSLCCPRPCLEPTPLYINGACLPVYIDTIFKIIINNENYSNFITARSLGRCVQGKCSM